ncbi:metalloprotease [Streptomyces sp. NPDC101230]|uniref:metalloprotease n=1 Tax=unclassified Streptomyces TaxID=2593676 RepID=UPI00362EEC2C
MPTRSHAPSAPAAGPTAAPTTRRRVLAAALAVGAGIALATPLTAGTAAAASTTCLNGTLAFDHNDAEAGTRKPLVTERARNSNWELWGRRTASGQVERLSSGLTGATDGRFSACHTGTAAPRDVHVRFFSSAGTLWRVVGAGTAKQGDPNWKNTTQYTFTTATRNTPAATTDLGTVKVPKAMQQAWKITDTLNQLYGKRGTGSLCWTAHQTSACDQLTVAWRQDGSSGGYWDHPSFPGDTSDGTDWVVLKADDPDSKHLILHEAGHWFQWQLHNKQWPPVRDCNGHSLDRGASAACGWTEGFANAVAAYALGDSRYTFSTGDSYDLLDQRVVGGWGKGDWVEGRVAAALLELWGPNGPDGGNWNRTLKLMNTYVSADFKQFFTQHRPLAGLSTTGAAKTIINRNTIVY